MDGTTGTAQTGQPTSEQTVDIREEAASVAHKAKEQTRNVVGGINEEFQHQVSEQKSRLASTIREIGDELDKASSSSSGTVADVAGEAAQRARQISGWVDTHEPGDAVRSLEDFARRKPMMFLLGAAFAGAVVGRVTRNALAARNNRPQSTGTGMDRGFYAGGVREDREFLGTDQQVLTGEVPPIGVASGQAYQPHMTGEPADEPLLAQASGPLSQRAHDAESAYPSNDQPEIEVGQELPQAGTRIGQGPRDQEQP